jgi:chromosome segregation ATPase
MEEKDFERIAQLIDGRFARFSVEFEQKLDQKLEDLSARFDAKLEDLSVRFDAKLEEQVNRLDRRMDALESRMDALESRMDGLDSRMDGLDSRMDRLEAKLDEQTRHFDKAFAALADGHTMLSEKLDRMEATSTKRNESVERRLDLHLVDPHPHGASRVMEK